MQKGARTGFILFCFFLLFFACTIRSGILVDRSFIPRFGLLSILVLVGFFTFLKGKLTIRNNLFETGFVLLYAWSMLSAAWSIEPAEALCQSQLVFLSLALFLVISAMISKDPGFEGIFIRILLLVLLFSFGLAFYKMSTLAYYDPYKIISVSANNNLYSGFLLISLPLVITGYILFKGFWKYFSVAVGILSFFFIIIIQTRAVYLGTIAALLIFIILAWLRYRRSFSGKNLTTIMISLLLLSGGMFIFTQTLDNTRKAYFLQKIMIWNYFRSYDDLQAKNIRKLREADMQDHTKMAAFDYSEDYYTNANLRMIFWQKSAGLIAKHPITGVGAGNWRLAIAGVREPLNPEHTIGNFTYSEPHNEWVRIISELGAAGFILALLVFFFPPGFVLYRMLFPKTALPIQSLVYAAFITGFFVYAAFDFPLRRVEHNILLWAIFAFMLSKAPLPQITKNIATIKPSAWISSLFLILGLFSVLVAVARFNGEYFTVLMFRNEYKEDDHVISYCQKAENPLYHITPNTLPVAWFEGVAHYRLGQNTAAENCFIRAMKRTPYEVRLLNDYSAVLFKSGRPEEAIRILKQTLYIDPFFDDARFNLGAIYFLTGNVESARREILQCRDSRKKRGFLEEIEKSLP